MDLGTAMPRSGGERIYLERIFKKPYMPATCMFMSYVVLLGFSTPNCIVLGEYVMYILGIEANRWNVRLVAVGVISVICFIHAQCQKTGLRIINILGVGKMVILVVIILSGIAGVYMGVGSSSSPLPVTPRRLRPDGYLPFDQERYFTTAQKNFSNLFAGSSTQPHDYATALLKVLYCYRGYSTANQVLGQVRNPIQTLKRTAPIALFLVSTAYICANIAYFAVVSREEFSSSGALIAGHFFRNVFGQRVGENILPLLIIISAFGNIAATSFAQARVNMELGRDGILPIANFFKIQRARGRADAQAEDQNATPGLFLHWLISVLFIMLPPPGEIYNFLVDIGGYTVSAISVAISLGLLYLQMTPSENWKGHHGCEAKRIYTIIFAASNILLLVLPWIKPSEVLGGGERFQWYAYPSTSLAILGLGVVYWVWWAKIRPIVFSEEGMELLKVQQRRYDSPELIPMMGSESGEEEDLINERLRMRLSAGSLQNLYM
ncbi:hypothetical protein HYALB_00000624 [Hymenoscyphus albidus]|uniref:High-affinity methionine permease n=1 Tax=Hymenoscyphus albidus TaxID=595503 RepID=A0A9N9M2F9_9HELO|nr:hypothetical protein HYALB_00000624 [Hymenoscyphus albidus]